MKQFESERGSSFHFSKDTFDAIPISMLLVFEIETVT